MGGRAIIINCHQNTLKPAALASYVTLGQITSLYSIVATIYY